VNNRIRSLVVVFVVVAIALLPLFAQRQWAVADPAPGEIVILPGPVKISKQLEDTIRAAFHSAADTITRTRYYAISGLDNRSGWYFVSVAGFNDLGPNHEWSLEGASWVGLVLATRNRNGVWSSAVEGTADFSNLLDRVPRTVLAPSVKANLDPRLRRTAALVAYSFPWQSGTSMMYGMKGVHSGGFPGQGSFKAIDFMSDGDITQGHAPNRLLAAAAGSISYVCDDGTSVAIRIGDVLYVHLMSNPNLKVGHSFVQGDLLGQLRIGSFSNMCGYADQGDNWFHVHWAFPDGPTFQAGGWTLSLADQLWHRGNDTRGIQQWMLSDNTGPAGWHVEYFADTTLTARCYATYENTVYVFKRWGANGEAPDPACPLDHFSARFTNNVFFQGGDYKFHVDHDFGARLYVDGQLLQDDWNSDGSIDQSLTLTGTHEVKVEYNDTTRVASLSAWWAGPGALPAPATVDQGAWRAEYYGNRYLWGQPAMVLDEGEGALSHDWASAGPGAGLPGDNFSARFTRVIDFTCGQYRFNVHADDGVRVWVGNQAVLDEWQPQQADFAPEIDLQAGAQRVKVEYFQVYGGAELSVTWQLLSNANCVTTPTVTSDLRPYTPLGLSGPVEPFAFVGSNITSTLYAGQITYFDWFFINSGQNHTTGSFAVEMWIDGRRLAREVYAGLDAGAMGIVNNWAMVVMTPGQHTVKLVVDADHSIPDAAQPTNIWQGTFTWQSLPPDVRPASWMHDFLPLVLRAMS
jgi:PA14 domain